jgi:hypothetical protein
MAPGVCVKKLITNVINSISPQARTSVIVEQVQAGLIFVGKARSLPLDWSPKRGAD